MFEGFYKASGVFVKAVVWIPVLMLFIKLIEKTENDQLAALLLTSWSVVYVSKHEEKGALT
jgi:hypothetical protein